MASLTMRMRTTSVYLVHSRMAEGSSSPEAETDTPVQLRLCDVKKLKETVENFQTFLQAVYAISTHFFETLKRFVCVKKCKNLLRSVFATL